MVNGFGVAPNVTVTNYILQEEFKKEESMSSSKSEVQRMY